MVGPRGRTSQQHRAVLSADSRQRIHNSASAGPVPALEDGGPGDSERILSPTSHDTSSKQYFGMFRGGGSSSACYLPRNANPRL